VPLTDAVFQQILDQGITQGGGQYLEVWPADIQNHPNVLAEANARIAATVIVTSGATIDIKTASLAEIIFGGSQGTLQLDQSASFTGHVVGFRANDEIQLKDIVFNNLTNLKYTASSDNTGGTLQVTDGIHMTNIALLGQYMATDFHLAAAGQGGTLVTDQAHPAGTQGNFLVASH
jgi:hypothetical protein